MSSRSPVEPDPHYSEPGLHMEACIARVREGDQDAARAFVQRLYPTVIKSVRRRLPWRSSEEDLVQDIFVKVFHRLDQFSGTAPLEHWVSRIAVNTCLNQIRHDSTRPEVRWADLSEEEEAVVQRRACSTEEEPGGEGRNARELVASMLGRLKPDERRVITLLHLEERSTEEISRMTGWSVSRIKVKAFRTRHKMRQFCQSFPI